MIKYLDYDSIDDYGQHIVPVNSMYELNKTASRGYSPELMKVITGMRRMPNRYYVVINALGSYETWGCNRNGDAFPVAGLTHKSLRTDMGTENDYGYKTFEYYAKLYKHHANKDPKRSFGDVIFSHWNPAIQRVELIVGIDTKSGKDIIDSLDAGEQVSCSMGCKVKYDRCSICDARAKSRAQYCKHLRDYLGKIVDADLAMTWSRELGRVILPGAQVFAWNDHPRFFDISRVYIGADRTSYFIGKAASLGRYTHSADTADAYGVTDDDVEKVAIIGKKSEIQKSVGSGDDDDVDGFVSRINKAKAVRKILDEKMSTAIASEPLIDNRVLNSTEGIPLENILSTLVGIGIHPKPAEFQRIVLVNIGMRNIADELEGNGIVFDSNVDCVPRSIDISERMFSPSIARSMSPYFARRSCMPHFIFERVPVVKLASASINNVKPDMFFVDNDREKAKPIISPALGLAGLAALYAGLKAKANGIGTRVMINTVLNNPILRSILGGGIMYKIYESSAPSVQPSLYSTPASQYENLLGNTNFSGIMKMSSLAQSVVMPNAYIANVYDQNPVTRNSNSVLGSNSFPEFVKTSGLRVGEIVRLVKKQLETMRP